MLEYLSIIYVLTTFTLLGSSRLGVLVKTMAAQGIVLALAQVAKEWNHLTPVTLALCAVTLAVKGWIFPKLLMAAVDRIESRREVDPIVGHTASLLIGLAMLVFAFWLQLRLPVVQGGAGLLMPAAFFGILSGFFITFARRKALTQVLGYLSLENGIFAFGAATLSGHPWLLELGVLLDVFVAVLIMGVAILHINREFAHMDADRLSSLHDGAGEAS